MQGTVSVHEAVSVVVRRGPQSMAFFAFVFAALYALFAAILNDHRPFRRLWVRTVLKCVLFCGLFLLVMKSAWLHNWLSANLLGSLTRENYEQVTMAFFAFTFAALFALFNTILNDYFCKAWIRTVLRSIAFLGLFMLVMKNSWVHHALANLLEWLRVERSS